MFTSFISLFGFTLPDSASSISDRVDNVYNFVYGASVIGFILLMGVMVYFLMKYKRQSKNDKAPANIHENPMLEILWTIIPAIIFVFIAVWGLLVYKDMANPPQADHTIYVIGKKWSWEFKYNFQEKSFSTANELVVPIDENIVLQMTSTDVLHSFYVPSFRIKKDLVPGHTTMTWFKAIKEGEFKVYCAEYCGTSHSRMLATVKVLSKEKYNEWVQEQLKSQSADAPLHELGKKVYQLKGCAACHSTDGSVLIGPSFKDLWETEREFTDGSKATADTAYVRESILNPQAKVVKGFQPVMNSYQGIISEDEIIQLIEYLKTLSQKSLKGNAKVPEVQTNKGDSEKGKQLMTQNACIGCHSIDGSAIVGPSFKGIWNTEREMSDGAKALFNIEYLQESLEMPNAKIVKGYEGRAMLSYKDKFSQQDILDIAAYLETLK